MKQFLNTDPSVLKAYEELLLLFLFRPKQVLAGGSSS